MAHRLGQPRSLTLRLSGLFAAVSLAVLSVIGVFLHHALTQQFVLRDAKDLNGKIELVRHMLADVDHVAAIRSSPGRWLDVVVGHHGLHLALFDENRQLVLASSALRLPARLLATPAAESVENAPVLEWRDTNGTHFRGVSGWGLLGPANAGRVIVAFAADLTEERGLLANYRTSIIGAVLAGAMIAAVLGTWVARRGLAPLQSVADAAGRITASRLSERLDAGAAPRELQALVAAYNAMLARLQDSFARLSQFSADLAHDLRTPIGNLLGEAQVTLARSRNAAEYRAVIESGVEELERLSRMIESMLFLARADHAQLALRPEIVRLDAELAKIRDYFEPLAQEKNLAIEVSGSQTLRADILLLRRAISNLVANAIRFTPPGTGTIRLASGPASADGIEISVSNPGPEIPLAERERVFDRFYRAGAARTDSSASSGLGLAIVQSICALHGGHASVDCAVGRTTFKLYFPPSPAQAETAPDVPAAS